MTVQAIRELINQYSNGAAGVAALAALLDARATGTKIDPALEARIEELLSALGGTQLLEGVSANEAAPIVAELRHHMLVNVKLAYSETRATSWSYDDPQLLQEVGVFARSHAQGITKNVIPKLAGLAERMNSRDAAFLNLGVGVAGLAVEFAEAWPKVRVLGLDVWGPALALARANVEKAGLRERIEIREQSAADLPEEKQFDLAWVPMLFFPEHVLAATTQRTFRALRPGGWAIFAHANLEQRDPVALAFWRLRTTMWGGPLWVPGKVEAMLREHGFTEVSALPTPPGVPVVLVVGRRPEASK